MYAVARSEFLIVPSYSHYRGTSLTRFEPSLLGPYTRLVPLGPRGGPRGKGGRMTKVPLNPLGPIGSVSSQHRRILEIVL